MVHMEGGASSSMKWRCMVHREGGRSVILHRTEVYGPHRERVGGRSVIVYRAVVYGPQGGRVRRRGVNIHRTEVSSPQSGERSVIFHREGEGSTSTELRCPSPQRWRVG